MPRTEIKTKQIKDQGVTRDDINTVTNGQSLITKVLAGVGITMQWTGADEGTGDVTISSEGMSSFSYRILINDMIVKIEEEQQMAVHGELKILDDAELQICGELAVLRG